MARLRCISCNAAVEYHNTKGSRVSQMRCTVCGGNYRLMRKTTYPGPAPNPEYTLCLFGQVYHNIYTCGGLGGYVYNKTQNRFISLTEIKKPQPTAQAV